MIDCILTIDYELYGNGAGSLKDVVHEPMRNLQSICDKWGTRLVVFVEVAELEKIEAFGSDRAIDGVKQQIRDLYQDGYEIGLHLHPQWCKARYEQGRWHLDNSEYNLCTLPAARISQILDCSLEYLRHIMNQPRFIPLSFRVGNWLFQPSEHVADALTERGIKIDSSVFKGGLQRSRGLDYRKAPRDSYFWHFRNDVINADPTGPLLEIPIYSDMVPFWRMATSKRLGFSKGLNPSNTPHSLNLNRARDLLRLQYPRKFDFCRMTLRELTSMMNRVIRDDQAQTYSHKPIVAIGHTKDLVDPQTIDFFLAFLSAKEIPVSTFEAVYSALSQDKRETVDVG